MISSKGLKGMIKGTGIDGCVDRHVWQQEQMMARMEEASALFGRRIDTQVIVMDFKGLSFWPDPKAFQTFRRVLEIDAKYYPETLGLHIMINCPWIFTGVWRIIKPWIDPARRDSAEDFSRLNALLCTAVDRILIPVYCFANS